MKTNRTALQLGFHSSRNAGLILLISCILSQFATAQSELLKPTIHYLVYTDELAEKSSSPYTIQRSAEFFGVGMFITDPHGHSSCSQGYRDWLKNLYTALKNDHPNATMIYTNVENGRMQLTDSDIVDIINFPAYNRRASFYCMIPLDATKTEKEVLLEYRQLLEKISNTPPLTYTYSDQQYNCWSASYNSLPVLGVSDIQTYERILHEKLIADLNSLNSKLDKTQLYSVSNLEQGISVSRASLFSLFFHKAYKISLLSKD